MTDVDREFEEYFRKFFAENAGRFTEDELEDKAAELYLKFGDEPLSSLGGVSPKKYFGDMKTAELINSARETSESGANVSDFQLEEIAQRTDAEDFLIENLKATEDEATATLFINLLRESGSLKAAELYLTRILEDYDKESVAESATEGLRELADEVKEEVLTAYSEASPESKKYLVEIMSEMSADDRIGGILIEEFKKHKDEIPLYAAYLGKYGDEKALPVLYEAIEGDINYVDFKELKAAIEALGGEYEKKRKFF